MDSLDAKLSEALSEPLSFYRDSLAGKIAALNIQLIEVSGDSVAETYPEIHNETRMAFTHVAGELIGFSVESADGQFDTLLEMIPGASYSALNEQLGRCCAKEVDYDALKCEAHKSMGHLRRAAMDADKAQYDALAEQLEEDFSVYRDHGIQNVDRGMFLSNFEEMREESRALYDQGKLSETLDLDERAGDLYRRSNERLRVAYRYFRQSRQELDQAKSLRRAGLRRFVVRTLVSIVFLIIGVWSLLAG